MIFDCLPTLKTWFWQPPTYVDIYIYIYTYMCAYKYIYIHIHIFFQSTRLPCVFQTSKLIIFWEFIGFSYPQNSNHRGPPTMAGTLATLATLYPPIICICWFGTPGVFPRFFSKFGAILLWDKKRELRIPWISVWSFFTWKHRSDAPKLPRSCWKRNKKKQISTCSPPANWTDKTKESQVESPSLNEVLLSSHTYQFGQSVKSISHFPMENYRSMNAGWDLLFVSLWRF